MKNVTVVKVTSAQMELTLSPAMVQAHKPECVILDEWAAFLVDAASNTYSQFGEDGLIEKLFDRIGTENEWCFEVGASDGLIYSNTKMLRDLHWSAVLIESSQKLIANLTNVAATEANSRVIGVEVGGDTTIDDLLEYTDAPFDMDLGVIDVDGQDYWLWYDMTMFMPRVMLVEYSLRNLARELPQRYGGGDMNYGQAGRDFIVELGKDKGYQALAATPCNVLFVLEDVLKAAGQ